MASPAAATVQLASDRLRVGIAPGVGAGITTLEARDGARWLALLRGKANPAHFGELGAFWMIPWCNRITGGRFTWGGRTYDLGTNWLDPGRPASAIHGVVCDAAWEVVERAGDALACRLAWTPDARTSGGLAWPWRFTAEVRYSFVDAATLRVEVRVANEDSAAMPLGVGLHPFVRRDPTGADTDAIRVRAATAGRMEARWLVPTGRVLDDGLTGTLRAGSPLAQSGADHTFDGFAGEAGIRWDTARVGLILRGSELFSRLHVFTRSPRDEWATEYAESHPFVAIEPVTQGADAFARDGEGRALGGEVIALGPRAEMSGVLEFAVTSSGS